MRTSLRSARGARRLSLALITTGAALLGVVPVANADLRVSKNQRLTADPSAFRGKDQISMAVNPNNPQHVVAANTNFHNEFCEASASFDGGTTWSTAAQLQPPPAGLGAPFLPSCRVSNHAGESIFQGVAFGSGNTVYVTSITPRATASVEQGASVLVYKSTDGGVTFGAATIALPGGASSSTGPYYELPSVLVQPGAGGADIVYAVGRDATGSGNSGPPCPVTRCDAVRVARSLDGGQTWDAPVQASPAGVPTVDAASPTIGADGSLGLTYRTSGSEGEIQFVRSTDQGQTWSAAVVVTKVKNVSRLSTDHITPNPSSASSFPRMAINTTNGNLYIVYNQGPPGPIPPAGGYAGADHFIPPDSHVYFQRSLDNGTTWSTPKLINDNTIHPGTQIVQTRHPSVSVAPNGRVDVVWEDRRHWYQGPGNRTCLHTHIFCDDARLGDAYYAFSTNDGGTFSANRRLSDHSHNNDVGYDYRFATYWAFGPTAVPLGNDQLLVAWMDSREGSYDTDTQDIYLAKVNHAASATVPQESVSGPSPTALAVKLSQQTYRGGGEGLMVSGFATRNGTKVVIVNENDSADALAASVLARANLGPVLLSPAGGLPSSVKAEVARLNPTAVFVVGDTSKLSNQVVADLNAAGVSDANIDRLPGSSSASRAAVIAQRMDRRTDAEKAAGTPAFDAAVIANPNGPDAYAAAALAAARRLPILYVSNDDMPSSTLGALLALDINRTLVIGGTGQIDDSVVASLPNPKRLGGADQYATSRAVAAESVLRGLPSNVVYAASGTRPIDAALTGFAVGRSTGIMVLAPGDPATTAASTAAAANLTVVDRLVAVEPTVAPAAGGGGGVTTPPAAPPPPAAAPGAKCGTLRLVKRNASKTRTRIDVRLRQPCAGKLTAKATVKLRVNGRQRTVSLKVSIKRLTGLNRSVRVTLSTAALRRLRQVGSLRVSVKATFTPSVLSTTSKKSSRTINVVVRQKKSN